MGGDKERIGKGSERRRGDIERRGDKRRGDDKNRKGEGERKNTKGQTRREEFLKCSKYKKQIKY